MVKSFRGREVDMVALAEKYKSTVALGNGSMNGRGDILGKGGKIIKTREEIIAESKASTVVTSGEVNLKEDSVNSFDKDEDLVKDSLGIAKPSINKRPKYEDITEEEKKIIDSMKNKEDMK